nr:DUF2255 family protein [Flexivirga oryzae]
MQPAMWDDNSRNLFGDAEEIGISTRRADGTLRPFVPIWVVSVDGTLYVRSYRGVDGAWYRHATRSPVGAIRAHGQQIDVAFAPAGDDVQDAIDAAYRAKYARYGDSYLRPMVATTAVAATLEIHPGN